MANKSNQAYKIAMVGLLAALSYVVFTYGQVKSHFRAASNFHSSGKCSLCHRGTLSRRLLRRFGRCYRHDDR